MDAWWWVYTVHNGSNATIAMASRNSNTWVRIVLLDSDRETNPAQPAASRVIISAYHIGGYIKYFLIEVIGKVGYVSQGISAGRRIRASNWISSIRIWAPVFIPRSGSFINVPL